MANTLVQNPAAVIYSGSTTVEVTFGSACTPGSWLTGCITQEHGATGSWVSCTDSGNGSWGAPKVSVLNGQDSGVGCGGAAIYAVPNASSAAVTITATIGVSSYGVLQAQEWSGPGATGAIGSNFATTSSPHTVDITTQSDASLVISCGTHYPSGAAVDTGYTANIAESPGSWSYRFGEYNNDVGAAGLKTLTYGLGNVILWSMCAVEFLPPPPKPPTYNVSRPWLNDIINQPGIGAHEALNVGAWV